MIHSPIAYLFIIAALATLFASLKQKSQLKLFSRHIYSVFFIALLSFLLSYVDFFASSKSFEALNILVTRNLLPAMIFLFFIDIDFKNILRSSQIGCSCTIGPKRYWFLLLLSFIASFLSQFLALHVSLFVHVSLFIIQIESLVFAAFFGLLLSFSRVKNINGIKDIATTMFYLQAGIFGSILAQVVL